MSEKQFHQAIEAMREVNIDPAAESRVHERIQHDALLRRRPWKTLSLAAAVLLALYVWPRAEEPAIDEPSALAPPEDPNEPDPNDDPGVESGAKEIEEEAETVEETPIPPPAKGKKKGKKGDALETVDGKRVEDKNEVDSNEKFVPASGVEPKRNRLRVEEHDFVGNFFETSTLPPDREAAKTWNAKLGEPLKTLRALSSRRIVVQMGEFDDVSEILRLYRIPHGSEARLDAEALKAARVVFLPSTKPPANDFDPAPLRKFVERGGWLVASGGGIHWIERALPDSLVALEREMTPKDALVWLNAGTGSTFLNGVIEEGAATGWWCPAGARDVGLRSTKARKLLVSPDWKKRFGRDAVVISCPYGKGLVLYSVAPFGQARAGVRADSVARMHRMLLNFLFGNFDRK